MTQEDNELIYEYIGNYSAVDPAYSKGMSCRICKVSWTGCWDNYQCPKCGEGELPSYEDNFSAILKELARTKINENKEYIEIAKLELLFGDEPATMDFIRANAVKLPEAQDSENDETQRRIGFTTAVKYMYELQERYPNQKLDKAQIFINFVREGSKWVNTPPQESVSKNNKSETQKD